MSDQRLVGWRQLPLVLAALARGEVVALPDVGGYVLAASAAPAGAVARLAALAPAVTRQRNYLVGDIGQARELADEWLDATQRLVDRCWPGPLTVLVTVPDASVPFVGLRMPAKRALRSMLRRSGPLVVVGLPVASAAEIASQFGADEVARILDGGHRGGPGPTVVDGTTPALAIRHEGALPRPFIEGALLMGTRRRWFRSKRTSGLT